MERDMGGVLSRKGFSIVSRQRGLKYEAIMKQKYFRALRTQNTVNIFFKKETGNCL